MLITLICLIVFVIGCLILKKDDYDTFGLLLGLIGGIGSAVCLALICIYNCGPMKLSTRTELQEKYNMYISQVYNSENSSHNIVMLSSEIAEYNTTIKTNRELQNNIWVGWFIPNIYDDMPIIEVKV